MTNKNIILCSFRKIHLIRLVQLVQKEGIKYNFSMYLPHSTSLVLLFTYTEPQV